MYPHTKRLPLCLFLIFLSLFFGCSHKTKTHFKQKDNSIVFNIGKGKLCITIFDTSIMQVRYTLADSFSTKKSLIIENKNWPKIPFDVRGLADTVTISTAKLKAKVNTNTGEIAFYNDKNSLLLKEKAGGGKTITPSNFEGYQTNTVRQQFQSSPDEALYGLGQHQDRLLNIKGYDLEFFQHNMEVYIPFFVSTRGYGLLWNNYSYTKFGTPDSIHAIAPEQMFDKNGRQGGLSLTLFKDSSLSNLMKNGKNFSDSICVTKNDSLVNAARFTGALLAGKTGEYRFYSHSDGTFKCWVNDSLIISNWAPYANARDMGRINLEKGKKYKIVVEWSRYSPNNSFRLLWRKPQDDNGISLWSRAGNEISYFVVAGKNMDSLISGYRELTGRASMLPKWAMGFWQSRERYKTQEQLLDVVKEFRKRKVPLDVIVQDWQYWGKNQWGSDVFDSTRYPDPKGMIDKLHNELHTKFVISVWAKIYTNTANFKELNEHGFMYQNPLKDSVRDFLKNLYSYYDAFNPKARKMYWNQIDKNLFSKGVDGWWLDASEPELPDYGPTPVLMARYMNPTYNGPGVLNLNAYPLMHTRGVYEGQRKTAPDQRVCILTRSAFAGEQRYGTIIWSGDISGEWGVLKQSLTAGLGFALSGMPYWTTDIGGFWERYPGGNKNKAYRELFTRWYQFGSFCPIFRVHGSNTPREIWFFGDSTDISYQTQLKFDRLRYRLMPYIYTLNGMVNNQNYTIMRALVMDFPFDKKTWNIKNQYLFGPSIMVNPVTVPGATHRQVYLPETSGWYNFWTGEFLNGGQTISAMAPYDQMPLYIKAGAIIPFGPDLQYAMEKPADPIELRVYTGDNGSFNLYEDENINYNYEHGAYSTIPFHWDEISKTLTIGKRKGTFSGMLQNRTFNVVFVDTSHGTGGGVSKKIDKVIHYTGEEVKIKK